MGVRASSRRTPPAIREEPLRGLDTEDVWLLLRGRFRPRKHPRKSRPDRRKGDPTTTPATSRCWRASSTSGSARACTSAPPAPEACITSSTRSSTTRSTRRWAATPTRIVVTLHADGSASVYDNGRGIPVKPIPGAKDRRPAVEVVLTTLNAGGKFGGGGYRISGGLHGVGVSVVNALSEKLVVDVQRDGFNWHQEYARGKPTKKLTKGRASTKTGTTVTVLARPGGLRRDPGVQAEDPGGAAARAGLPQQGRRDRPDRRARGAGPQGDLQGDRRPRGLREAPRDRQGRAHQGHRGRGEGRGRRGRDRHAVEHGYAESFYSFANTINTHEGGMHEEGLKKALTNVLNRWARATRAS